ncbi:MAG: N-formylglutamate amidohydrolase [Pseudomonadota bacterium]
MTESAFQIVGMDRPSRWVVTCDHATNRVPENVNGGDLGVPTADMVRHIAYDIGAAGVTRALAAALDAPAILSNFSRLVIDPNRGEDDPTLVMRIYDGSIIPANRHVGKDEIERRLEAYHRPYHQALANLLADRRDPVIAAVHSFTPQLHGRPPRPWHVGILHAGDIRLAHPVLTRLRAEADLCVGENQPYSGHLEGDAMDRHALKAGYPNVLVELRNDLIDTMPKQREWGVRLASVLDAALQDAQV